MAGAYLEMILTGKDVEIITAPWTLFEPTPNSKVLASAVLDTFGTIFYLDPPAKHADVVKLMQAAGRTHPSGRYGFLTSDGRFLSRALARLVAVQAGQLISDPVKLAADPNLLRKVRSRLLLSSALW